MSLRESPRAKRGAKLLGTGRDDPDGVRPDDGCTLRARARRPKPMRASRGGQRDRLAQGPDHDRRRRPGRQTTPQPPSSRSARSTPAHWDCGTPGVLTVGTLSDAPPYVCINATGQFSGFDNQLLRAIAKKLGLQVRFVSTDFSGAAGPGGVPALRRRLRIGESHRRAASHRRVHQRLRLRLLRAGGAGRIADQRFSDLADGQRIGVVQGTVEESYVVDDLASATGEISRLRHRVRQPQDPPDRRVGGAGERWQSI